MAQIVLIILAILAFFDGLFCYFYSEPLASLLGLGYHEGVILGIYPMGAALIVFGVMFIIGSKDTAKRRFIMDMGILFLALNFVSLFIVLARLGSLTTFFWAFQGFTLILLILLIVSRPKAATT